MKSPLFALDNITYHMDKVVVYYHQRSYIVIQWMYGLVSIGGIPFFVMVPALFVPVLWALRRSEGRFILDFDFTRNIKEG